MTELFKLQKTRPGRERMVKDDAELRERVNDILVEGFLLDKGTNGEIIELTLAPNESKIIPHGLRGIPLYRLILRQTGNGIVTDLNSAWTERSVGFTNESANELVLTIKLFRG